MDTLAKPSGEASPTEPGLPSKVEQRRVFYQSLIGAAIGGRYQL